MTPLQQATLAIIAKLKEAEEDMPGSQLAEGKSCAYRQCINILNESLPRERRVIAEAYTTGLRRNIDGAPTATSHDAWVDGFGYYRDVFTKGGKQ